MHLRPGLYPDPAGGAYSAPQTTSSILEEVGVKDLGREGERKGGREREERERE